MGGSGELGGPVQEGEVGGELLRVHGGCGSGRSGGSHLCALYTAASVYSRKLVPESGSIGQRIGDRPQGRDDHDGIGT